MLYLGAADKRLSTADGISIVLRCVNKNDGPCGGIYTIRGCTVCSDGKSFSHVPDDGADIRRNEHEKTNGTDDSGWIWIE